MARACVAPRVAVLVDDLVQRELPTSRGAPGGKLRPGNLCLKYGHQNEKNANSD